MTVLSKRDLRLKLRDPDSGLVLTPILTGEQIGDSSVDVRLGNEFIQPIKAVRGVFDYTAGGDDSDYHEFFRRIRRDFGEHLFIHPNQLILGATLEFARLPDTLCCDVIGKSSLGRAGLVIATATAVAPGFAGCITLEIVNLGEVPVPIYPGMRIAQLVFHATTGGSRYSGRFDCATGPMPPGISADKELHVWTGSPTSSRFPAP